jgi:hypothetical protein
MSEIQYAGEYILDECILCTVGGLEIDLTDLVASISIFEDIFKNSITGSISFVDTNSITANASIIGQEKLKLVLVTPNADDDTKRTMAINFSDTPLHIYQVAAKENVNDNTTAFTLRFTTAELVKNNKIRVCQSYTGEPAKEIIKKILRDPELLNSKKEFYYEETTNLFKLIVPNMRPFDFINTLSKRCLSKEYNFSPSFLFYETIKGYYFRTVDSMMDRKNPRAVYREVTPNDQDADIVSNLQNILSYEVTNSTDTILNRRAGMYNSELLMLDVFNKSYKHYEYKYLEEFDKDVHVDEFNAYGSAKAPIASKAPDDDGKLISDYPQSILHVQTIERDVVDEGLNNPAFNIEEINYTGTDQWLQKRRSRFNTLEGGISIRIKVPGNTTIQAGDLVGIQLKNKSGSDIALDPYMTGRYLVRNLKHEFTKGVGQIKHEIYLDCIRDTVQVAYPAAGVTALDGGTSTEEVIPRGSADAGDVKF